MTVTANLKFTQGSATNAAGQSFIATVGSAVTVGNGDNTGANDWTYSLLDVPYGSANARRTLSAGGSSTTTFTPDKGGSYRIQVTVRNTTNGSIATQTRNVLVPNTRGWIVPSFRTTADEMNETESGSPNDRGWATNLAKIFADLETTLNGLSSGEGTITGATNIGNGDGEIFSDTDVNGVIRMRRISGSGSVTVDVSGDNVDIGSYAEINTLVSQGGTSLALDKTDSTLPILGLSAGTNISLDLSANPGSVTISAAGSVGESNTVTNVGTGAQIAKTKAGVDIPVRTIIGGTNITVTQNANDITIAAAGSVGEANTVSNVGTGAQIAQAKSGINFPFRTIIGAGLVTATQNTNDVTVATTAEINTNTNVGTGAQIAQAKSGSNTPLRSIVAGTGISATQNANDVTIASTVVPGETNTMSNVGAGAGTIYQSKTGVNFTLKTIVAGTGVTVTNGTDTVTVSATGGGGSAASGTNLGSASGFYVDTVSGVLEFKSFRTVSPLGLSISSSEISINLGGLSGFGTANQYLAMNSSGTAMTWVTGAGGGGGSTVPGGAAGTVQFNGSGAFAGATTLLWNSSTNQLYGGFNLAWNATVGGQTLPTTSFIRTNYSVGSIISQAGNSVGTVTWNLLSASNGSAYIFGTSGSDSVAAGYIIPSSLLTISFGSTPAVVADVNSWRSSLPRLGNSSPFASEGWTGLIAGTTTPYTLSAAEYSNFAIGFSSAAVRTVVVPAPATAAATYMKAIYNPTAVAMTVSNGAGSATTSEDGWHLFLVTPSGVGLIKGNAAVVAAGGTITGGTTVGGPTQNVYLGVSGTIMQFAGIRQGNGITVSPGITITDNDYTTT